MSERKKPSSSGYKGQSKNAPQRRDAHEIKSDGQELDVHNSSFIKKLENDRTESNKNHIDVFNKLLEASEKDFHVRAEEEKQKAIERAIEKEKEEARKKAEKKRLEADNRILAEERRKQAEAQRLRQTKLESEKRLRKFLLLGFGCAALFGFFIAIIVLSATDSDYPITTGKIVAISILAAIGTIICVCFFKYKKTPFIIAGAFFMIFLTVITVSLSTRTSKYVLIDNAYYSISGNSAELISVKNKNDLYFTIPSYVNGVPVTKIGENALSGLIFTSVNIPSSVTQIGSKAFENCYNLVAIEIPSTVTYVGDYVFTGCRALTELTVPYIGGTFPHSVGLFFSNSEMSGFVQIKQAVNIYRYSFDTFYVPQSFEKLVIKQGNVNQQSINGCSTLKEIVIEDKSSTIAEGAFAGLSNLESLTLPYIGADAGENSYSDEFGYIFGYYNYDNSFSAIQGNKYYKIPYSLKNIEITGGEVIAESAFEGLTYIEKITLPQGLKRINKSAFLKCYDLLQINIPDSVEYIGKGAFESTGIWNSQNSESIKYVDRWAVGYAGWGDVVLSYNTRGVAEGAFSGFDYTYVSVPASVKHINEHAFSSSNVQSVYFESGSILEKIDNSVFSNCSNLTSINLPDSLKEIGDDAFNYCPLYDDFYLPSNLERIGENAFFYSNIKNLIVPPSVSFIGYEAFARTSLESLEIYGNNLVIDGCAFDYCLSLVNLTLHEGIKEIEYYAFRFSNLTEVIIPLSVSYVGSGAFRMSSQTIEIYCRAESQPPQWDINFGIYNNITWGYTGD